MNDSRSSGVPWFTAPAALVVLTCIGAIRTDRPLPVIFGLSVAMAAASGVLAWRGVAGWPLVAGLTVPAAGIALACYGDPRNVGWFGACVIVGWAALATPFRAAVGAGAAMAAVFAIQMAMVSPEPGWVTWMAGTAFTTGACTFVRRQRVVVDQLHAAQEELAQRARNDERHRIAREMHDLVGHSLTVTLLHLGSARLALDDDLDAAKSCLDEAEHAARNSLEDVRAAVGLMGTTDLSDAPPVCTAADITDLVESYRRAGADIELDISGDVGALAPNRSLAAFRIVQESLTNAVRHGDGTPISVRIEVLGDRARVMVRNGAPTRRPPATGTGITAMRERADALGGRLTAGPHEDGWLVEGVIPA